MRLVGFIILLMIEMLVYIFESFIFHGDDKSLKIDGIGDFNKKNGIVFDNRDMNYISCIVLIFHISFYS